VVRFGIGVSIDGPVDTAFSDEVEQHLLANLREALTNVGPHAHASRASVILTAWTRSCLSLQPKRYLDLVAGYER